MIHLITCFYLGFSPTLDYVSFLIHIKFNRSPGDTVGFYIDNFLHCCCSRKWVGGEVIQALAYDVPIPGYKTKNTISLCLWEAKASAGDFILFQFNDGQYESAAQLHSKAQRVCCL